jgi:hypothetical protein
VPPAESGAGRPLRQVRSARDTPEGYSRLAAASEGCYGAIGPEMAAPRPPNPDRSAAPQIIETDCAGVTG